MKRFKTENQNSNSHFKKWHTVVNLVREHKRCSEKLTEIRPKATTADDNEEEDLNNDDGDDK